MLLRVWKRKIYFFKRRWKANYLKTLGCFQFDDVWHFVYVISNPFNVLTVFYYICSSICKYLSLLTQRLSKNEKKI